MIVFRRLLNCRALMLACCLLGAGVWPLPSTFAQEETAAQTDNKPARSTVRGRVLFADSEQPLRRATLILRKEFESRFEQRSISSRRGEFTFQGVAAGTYYIDVDVPGIISPRNGQSLTQLGYSRDESSLPLVTVDGSNEVKTEIRVTRGGAITGRISYADGEPATNAQVILYRQKGQTPVLFFTGSPFYTDDRGVYRIEGLPSGEYYVGAVENHAGAGKTYPRDAIGLVTAYHPDVTSVSAATMVSVQASSETRNINIKFGDEPRRLSGTLKWKQGDGPIKRAVVVIRRIGDPPADLDYQVLQKTFTPAPGLDKVDLMMRDLLLMNLLSTNSPYVETGADGRWSFLDVTPGTYLISAHAPVPVDEPEKPRSAKPKPDDFDDDLDFSKGVARGTVEVTVKDKNIDNVAIELTVGGSILGSVVIEGDSSGPVAISANSTSLGLESALNFPAYVQTDRTFALNAVPAGIVRLDIYEPRGPHYYIRSMTGKGLDLLTEPLKLNEGEQVTGVQIVLGSDLATVDGSVVAASGGGSVAGAGVALLPVDQRKWNLFSTWGMAHANAEGKFSLRLAPGDYFVLAWTSANEPTPPFASHFRSQLPTMRRITLQPNETKALTVQVSTKTKETARKP
jgi:hypothetical protein